jgi:HAE1 family hydrophobic/amphiphilic exporter-1
LLRLLLFRGLSSRYGKLEHIEKTFWKNHSCFESYLTVSSTDSGLLTWSLDHYKTTLAIVLFFSSIALVPAVYGGEFFAASDSGEFWFK